MNEFCVDYEIAKELKINGFTQNTKFYWHNIHGYSELEDFKANDYADMSNCSAPFSDEILKELPRSIIKDGNIYIFEIYDKWIIDYVHHCYEPIDSLGDEEISDDKFPNALAKMWLYLKKEGYIK